MAYFRRTGGQLALFLLSLIGMGVAIYLTFVHYDSQGVPLVCSSSGLVNCENVLSSAYSFVPGTTIPVSVAGILWFVVSIVLTGLAWRVWPQSRNLLLAEVAWTSIGMLTVFYLVYAELVRIHSICIWCTSIHIITLIMFLITIVLLQAPTNEIEDEEEELEQPVLSSKERF